MLGGDASTPEHLHLLFRRLQAAELEEERTTVEAEEEGWEWESRIRMDVFLWDE